MNIKRKYIELLLKPVLEGKSFSTKVATVGLLIEKWLRLEEELIGLISIVNKKRFGQEVDEEDYNDAVELLDEYQERVDKALDEVFEMIKQYELDAFFKSKKGSKEYDEQLFKEDENETLFIDSI